MINKKALILAIDDTPANLLTLGGGTGIRIRPANCHLG
jgi:hypothetical protein